MAENIHAGCVALEGRGLLILGPSGAGKSALALELMARGAALVSDDRTELRREGAALIADAPEALKGMIEARGMGILRARPAGPVPLVLVADLGETETDRLPPRRSKILLGVSLPLLHNTGTAAFPAAILQYLREGRIA